MTARISRHCFTAAVGAATAAAMLCAGGCNRPKSPDTAAQDIAAASQSAAHEVDKAKQELQRDVNNDTYEVALARADGVHKVAIQKCDLAEGHDQKLCKDQADADFEAAKANAKVNKVAATP